MAGFAFDPRAILDSLAVRRPIFHSEADFQFEFAWETKQLVPDANVRLEIRLMEGEHLDLLVRERDHFIAIELKYPTRAWLGQDSNGEDFRLLDHSAHDLRRYDILKDMARVERLVERGAASSGYTVVLTNDERYWSPPRRAVVGNDAMFRIHDGAEAIGLRTWSRDTAGTVGRPGIELSGTYSFAWSAYSSVDTGARGILRSLVVESPHPLNRA
jgi:hypothetical protein